MWQRWPLGRPSPCTGVRSLEVQLLTFQDLCWGHTMSHPFVASAQGDKSYADRGPFDLLGPFCWRCMSHPPVSSDGSRPAREH